MRFIAFRANNQKGIATETTSGEIRGLRESDAGYPGDLSSLLREGNMAMQTAHKKLAAAPDLDPEKITFLPPIANPGKILCVGLNYADHIREGRFRDNPPKEPVLFCRYATSLVGHNQPILRPRVSDQLDFEAELVAVIGKPGRHISRDSALEHVAGYSIFNDASIRDYQHRGPQWTMGKNFDATGAFGPAFVTADEVPSGGSDLKIETRLNGEVMQSSNTDQLFFNVAVLIAYITEAMTLEAGDVLVTGTPSGVGNARDPKVFMRDGDVCEVTIAGLGTLRNPIADEPAA
jgi:2-keto-4-pentenoate hydratase/2-oxohepta-3-ene-1,7-dioic acid hydratase in catechol pathway